MRRTYTKKTKNRHNTLQNYYHCNHEQDTIQV